MTKEEMKSCLELSRNSLNSVMVGYLDKDQLEVFKNIDKILSIAEFLLTSLTKMEERVKELEDENKTLHEEARIIIDRSEAVFYRLEQAEAKLTSSESIHEAEKKILIKEVEDHTKTKAKLTKLCEAVDRHRKTPNSTHAVFGIDGKKQEVLIEVLILAKLEADNELYRTRDEVEKEM